MGECTKVRVLTDFAVTVDPPAHCSRWERDKERIARNLERWADEFHEFIRDHRSQDPITLNIERIYQDQCSVCGGEWETMDDEMGLSCAHCGASVKREAA